MWQSFLSITGTFLPFVFSGLPGLIEGVVDFLELASLMESVAGLVGLGSVIENNDEFVGFGSQVESVVGLAFAVEEAIECEDLRSFEFISVTVERSFSPASPRGGILDVEVDGRSDFVSGGFEVDVTGLVAVTTFGVSSVNCIINPPTFTKIMLCTPW
jgi:hypothetical protein